MAVRDESLFVSWSQRLQLREVVALFHLHPSSDLNVPAWNLLAPFPVVASSLDIDDWYLDHQ